MRGGTRIGREFGDDVVNVDAVYSTEVRILLDISIISMAEFIYSSTFQHTLISKRRYGSIAAKLRAYGAVSVLR